MSELIQTGFDYATLPAEVALKAQLAATSIKLRLKRTVEDIIEIGRELTAVKDELPHGQFLPWIAAEFEMSDQTAQNFMNVCSRFGQKPNYLEFKPTVLYALAAPSTPDSVVEKAVEKAEAGGNVTVADVKDWKAELAAERQARDLFERRALEFQAESNERRKTIRALEAQIDLLKNQPAPEPERVYVAPADYDTLKAESARLRQQIDAIEARKDQLVQQQVVAKLKEREREIESLEHRANQLKGTIDSYQSHIAKVHLPEMEMQQQIKVVEDFIRACAGLAAGLSMFEHAPNAATASIWQKGIAAASDAAQAMRLHVDRRPELTVIQGAPQAA